MATLEAVATQIRSAIDGLGCISVAQTSILDDEIRFLCRVKPTKSAKDEWFDIMTNFLKYEQGWRSFFGLRYFKHEQKIVYAWTIRFSADDLPSCSVAIVKLFNRCKIFANGGIPNDSNPEVGLDTSHDSSVIESPLLHAGRERTAVLPKNVRGARELRK